VSTRIKLLVPFDAPMERVVERLARFETLGDWHPALEPLGVEGAGDGAIRSLQMGDWVIRDRLDQVDPSGHGYRYTQLAGPVGARDHRGYLWVHPREYGTATVEWAAKIKGTQLPEPIAGQLLEAIMAAGLKRAKIDLEG